MASIHLLEDSLIDKIAAGEVVERPASVVKELLENAIDAGATNVRVELEEGGSKQITVIDNGSGISRDELPLAVQRHATSKIAAVEDLFAISSMGFRGEALASIAAVSHFSISSLRREDRAGARLSAVGSIDWQLADWQGSPGTIVSIRDLFFNVPARLKFLKSAQSEYAACLELIEAMALANPHVGFTFSHNGKDKFYAPALDDTLSDEARLRARAETVLSREIVSQLLYVAGSNEFGTVTGLVSPPGLEKATSKSIYTFVNKRWVKDKAIRYGIMRGYHTHLLSGKFPIALLFYDCEPSLVDVNVHPAKTEVRFQYGTEMQALLATSIREAIRKGTWAAPEPKAQLFSKAPATSFDFPITPRPSPMEWKAPSSLRSEVRSKEVYSPPSRSWNTETIPVEDKDKTPTQESIPWHDLKWRGSLFACYLFFEYEDKLLVIDQHAFHERVLFEKLQNDPDILSHIQPLLVPEVIDFSSEEVAVLCEAREMLAGLGIDFVPVSSKEIELRSVPTLLVGKDIRSLLSELAALDLKANDKAAMKEGVLQVAGHVLATVACHSAVRQGENLSEKEWQQLLIQAQTVDFQLNCPHGRRVFRWFGKSAVERWFDR